MNIYRRVAVLPLRLRISSVRLKTSVKAISVDEASPYKNDFRWLPAINRVPISWASINKPIVMRETLQQIFSKMEDFTMSLKEVEVLRSILLHSNIKDTTLFDEIFLSCAIEQNLLLTAYSYFKYLSDENLGLTDSCYASCLWLARKFHENPDKKFTMSNNEILKCYDNINFLQIVSMDKSKALCGLFLSDHWRNGIQKLKLIGADESYYAYGCALHACAVADNSALFKEVFSRMAGTKTWTKGLSVFVNQLNGSVTRNRLHLGYLLEAIKEKKLIPDYDFIRSIISRPSRFFENATDSSWKEITILPTGCAKEESFRLPTFQFSEKDKETLKSLSVVKEKKEIVRSLRKLLLEDAAESFFADSLPMICESNVVVDGINFPENGVLWNNESKKAYIRDVLSRMDVETVSASVICSSDLNISDLQTVPWRCSVKWLPCHPRISPAFPFILTVSVNLDAYIVSCLKKFDTSLNIFRGCEDIFEKWRRCHQIFALCFPFVLHLQKPLMYSPEVYKDDSFCVVPFNDGRMELVGIHGIRWMKFANLID